MLAVAVTLNVPEVFFVVGLGVAVGFAVGRAVGLGVAVVLVSVLSSLTEAVVVVLWLLVCCVSFRHHTTKQSNASNATASTKHLLASSLVSAGFGGWLFVVGCSRSHVAPFS